MTNEEIRKLLGGYATNTLTATERRALFEAALEDQELFNALEDEQALKDLIADPASREAIQRALREPVEQQIAWWSRGWVWGGLASAAAAAVLIVAAVHQSGPAAQNGRVEIAATREPAKSVLEPSPAAAERKPAVADRGVKQAAPAPLPTNQRRELKEKEFSRDNLAPATAVQLAAPAVPPTPPAKSEQANAEVEAKPLAGLPGGAIGGVAGSVSGFAASAKLDPLRYSLLKRDAQGGYTSIPSQTELRPGDSVRLNVSTAVTGYLSLYQQVPSGEWKLIFPESPEGRLVTANSDSTIPEAAIEVQDGAQKFRISLTLENAGARAKTARQRSVGALEQSAALGTVPLTVDLTIAARKIP